MERERERKDWDSIVMTTRIFVGEKKNTYNTSTFQNAWNCFEIRRIVSNCEIHVGLSHGSCCRCCLHIFRVYDCVSFPTLRERERERKLK